MQTNEFRVRPVTRFILSHYQADPEAHSSSSRQIGEFLSIEAAEEVGVAMQALVPGSTLETIEGRQAAYPPKALAAAMAVRQDDVAETMARSDAWLMVTHALDRSYPGWASLSARGVDAAVKAIETLAQKMA